MTDPSERLERAIAQLGAEHEPPADWQAKVLAAIESSQSAPSRWAWLRRWWPAIPAFAVAAGVLALWLRPVSAGPLMLAMKDVAGGEMTRSVASADAARHTMPLGGKVELTVRGGGKYHALRVYRSSGGGLELECPGAAECRSEDGALTVVFHAKTIGRYQVLALTSDKPLPPSSKSYDTDSRDAIQAHLDTKDPEIEVQ